MKYLIDEKLSDQMMLMEKRIKRTLSGMYIKPEETVGTTCSSGWQEGTFRTFEKENCSCLFDYTLLPVTIRMRGEL